MLISPGLDSTRSSDVQRPAETSSEDDYEELNYKREAGTTETLDVFNRAEQKEEVVLSEPIYTMVIKSPKLMKAIDRQSSKDHVPANDEKIVAVVPDQVVAPITNTEEVEPVEPEMERDAGDGQTESPVMWEYKLPAPPTPFADSNESPLDKLQIACESSLSRRSSMSSDSLRQASGDEEEPEGLGRSSIDQQESITEIFIKEERQSALRLDRGAELLGETATEDQPLDYDAIAQVTEKVVEDKEVVVLVQSSDPEAKQYGIESTTDGPISVQVSKSNLPPVPSTLPPSDSEEDSTQSDLRFSIATYDRRVKKDSTYDKKLQSGLPDGPSINLTLNGNLFFEISSPGVAQ